MENLLKQLDNMQEQFPSKQRKLCKYIISHGKSAYLMSVGKLAEESGVGRATVMRLIESLGFATYADFKAALNESNFTLMEEDYKSNPFFWENSSQPLEGDIEISDSIAACCDESIALLQQAKQDISRESFSKIVDLLIAARTVNILGLRTSSAISRYASYMLSYFLDDVRDLSENESLIYDRIVQAKPGDVVLIFGSASITATSTRVAKLCKARGIPVILIVDDAHLEIVSCADCVLITPRTDSTRLTVIPFLMLLESLINEIGVRMAPLSVNTMNEINHLIIQEGIVQN